MGDQAKGEEGGEGEGGGDKGGVHQREGEAEAGGEGDCEEGAAFEYARRLEKVWKHTEAFAARCEAEHDRALHEAEARTSSYTEIRLDQLEMKSKMSRARAESAKQAYDTCLMQYRALEKEGRR